jgi:hypothetical protein
MNSIRLIPKKGIQINEQQINLGMSTDDIQNILGVCDKESIFEFVYPNNIEKYKDLYFNKLLVVISMRDDKIIFVEMPPQNSIFFSSINLSKSNFKETIKYLQRMGYEYIFYDNTYIFSTLNFFIYAPENETIESIGIFEDNYFDNRKEVREKYNITMKRENNIDKYIYTYKS